MQERSVARQQDWGITPAAVDGELAGLVRGLSELNPALHAYTQQTSDRETSEGLRQAEELAKADAEVAEKSSLGTYDVAGQPLPTVVRPAFGDHYRRAFGDAMADRVGAETVAKLQQEYDDKRGTPGFDPAAFLSEARATALGSFASQPRMVARIGQHLAQFEGQVRASTEKDRVRELSESRDTAIASSFASRIRDDMTPAEVASEYFSYLLPQATELTFTRKEAAKLLLSRVVAMSDRLGGAPEKFDVFNQTDAEGVTLAARNPDLSAHIQREREQAQAKQDRVMLERSQRENFRVMTALTQKAEEDPHSITEELIAGYIGPRAPFRTHDEALAFWHRARVAAQKADGTKALQGNFEAGTLHLLPKEAQQDILEANLGGYVRSLTESIRKGDPAPVAELMAGLMAAQSRSGSSEPLQSLQRFTQALVSTIPSADGPDVRFQAAASIYKSTAAAPQFREMYFKDDVSAVLKSYVESVETGAAPRAAYTQAYQSISPEAKAAASRFIQSPDFQKRLQSAYKHVAGSSLFPRWLGGNGRPENREALQAVSQEAVRSYLQRSPFASDEDVEQYVQQWVGKNFILDTTSGTAIRVPPSLAGQGTQEAVSEYTKRLSESLRLKDRKDADWRINLVRVGDGDMYQVEVRNGAESTLMGRLPLSNIVQAYQDERTYTEPDRKVLSEVFKQVRSGKVDPNFLNENRSVIAKARAMKHPGWLDKLDQTVMDAMRQRLQSVPAMAFGNVDLRGLQYVPQRGAKVDNKLTGDLAMRFATEPMLAPGMQYKALAASLITMGEGAVLQSYPDPAKDAGNNIGMGYNLKANAKQASDELKRAGVPAERIPAVIDGTAQLTPEQAARLLQVAMPRYEKLAQDTAEKTAPGLWKKMTPVQQAIMVDIAYQVGDVGQFREAWSALAKNDVEAFSKAAKVHYRNKEGTLVPDERRNGLRAAMLQGIPQWYAVVQRYAGLPGNALDSAKVGQ